MAGGVRRRASGRGGTSRVAATRGRDVSESAARRARTHRDSARRARGLSRGAGKGGSSARGVSRTDAPGVAAHVALREGLALLLGAPLAACGIAVHMVPYQLTAAIVRRLRRTDEEEATDKIATGLVLYPIGLGSRGRVSFRLRRSLGPGGLPWRSVPSGFFALAWRERLDRLAREARAFAAFFGIAISRADCGRGARRSRPISRRWRAWYRRSGPADRARRQEGCR